MPKGKFIVLEGPDGLGKSTQTIALRTMFEDHGRKVLTTREPGGSQIGDTVRSLLLNPEYKLSNEAELFLFFADRADHVKNVIKPALEEGYVVLCDRYVHSTYVYQHIGRGFPLETLKQLHEIATGSFYPDASIILTGENRRGDIMLNELDELSRDNQKKFAEGYKMLGSFVPNTYFVDAMQNTLDVTRDIAAALRKARVM